MDKYECPECGEHAEHDCIDIDMDEQKVVCKMSCYNCDECWNRIYLWDRNESYYA